MNALQRFIYGPVEPAKYQPSVPQVKVLTPVQQRFQQMISTAPYSPDIIKLEHQRRQVIFVADDMMRGGKLFNYIEETSLTGRHQIYGAYTEAEYFMWKKDLGEDSFPVVLEKDVTGFYSGPPLEPAKIRGEVYSIRSYQFRKLDFLRENGVLFFRHRVNIIVPRYKVIHEKSHPLPHLKENNKVIEAWMYFGNHDYWDDQLAGVIPSSPVPLIEDHARDWLKKYYLHKNE